MTAQMIIIFLFQTASTMIFCSFVTLFILPRILIRFFYTAPSMGYFALRGHVRLRGMLQPLYEAFLWIFALVFFYGLSYVLEPDAFYMITRSAQAIITYSVCIPSLFVSMVRRFPETRKDFYHNTYLKYATPKVKKAHEEFVSEVSTLYPIEIYHMLAKGRLSFLQREALRERLTLSSNVHQRDKVLQDQ